MLISRCLMFCLVNNKKRQAVKTLVVEVQGTISKWETGKGYPDITLLEPIADALSVSVTELISENTVYNSNVPANMLRSKFYICPVCGNVIHGMGEAVIHCHGVLLQPTEAEETDEDHKIFVERVEDEYYVCIEHEMSKNHYISFIAAVSSDRMQMVKLYPEGNAEARFKINGGSLSHIMLKRLLDILKNENIIKT